MRNHYIIRLVDYTGIETELKLYATQYQIDKVFYSLAFASNDGSYSSGVLLLNNKAEKKVLKEFRIKELKKNVV